MTSIRKWSGLAIGLFGIVLSAWNLSFNTIVIPLKLTFNFTQSEVEMVSSMILVGTALSPLEPLISRQYGYQVSYLMGGLMAPVTAGLNCLAVHYPTFFSSRPILFGLLQTLVGVSTQFLYLLIVGIAVENLPNRHTGKALGIFMGIGALGKMFYSTLMLCVQGDLGTFFAIVTVVWTCVFGGCLVLHRKQSDSETVSIDDYKECKEWVTVDEIGTTPLQMVKTRTFHLTFWPTVIFYANMMAYLTNITCFGDSAGMQTPITLIYEIAFVIGISRIIIGIVFDSFYSTFVTFIVICSCYICYITAMIMGMFWFCEAGLYVMTLLAGIGVTAAYSLPITMLLNVFGRKNHTLIISMICLCGPLLVIFLQSLIGRFYDNEIDADSYEEIFCRGNDCFFNAFLLLLLSSILGLALQILNAISFRLR